jgi:tetratricopeptide (TPR) repeat protein
METKDGSSAAAPSAAPQQIYETARDLYKQKRYEEIVSLCSQAEAAGNYSADVAAIHSVALMKLGRAEETIEFLHRMLYYFPYDARLHFNLGTAYQTTFRGGEARHEYQLARQLDPENVGRKVDRRTNLRIVIVVTSFALFFAAIAFWPHTKWLLVGLIGLMIALNVFVIVNAARTRSVQRLLLNAGMFVLWIILLLVVILL